jgi:hypothetical protein
MQPISSIICTESRLLSKRAQIDGGNIQRSAALDGVGGRAAWQLECLRLYRRQRLRVVAQHPRHRRLADLLQLLRCELRAKVVEEAVAQLKSEIVCSNTCTSNRSFQIS